MNVYAQNNEQFELFLKAADSVKEFFQINRRNLNGEIAKDESPHFSIFLLSTHFANNIWMINQVQSIKQQGAHDQNSLFILTDRERVKKEDMVLIERNLKSSLKKVISEPQIISMSLGGYAAYINKDFQFMYWDDELSEYRTIKEIEDGNENRISMFNQFLGIDKLKEVLMFWKESPYLLFWKNTSRPTVITKDVPTLVITEIEKRTGYNVTVFDQQSDFERMSKDLEIVSFTAVHTLAEASDILEENKNVNVILLDSNQTVSNAPSDDRLIVFSGRTYEKRKLPQNILEVDQELLILDEKGYPIPKNKIMNWDTTLYRASGLSVIVEKVEEVKK